MVCLPVLRLATFLEVIIERASCDGMELIRSRSHACIICMLAVSHSDNRTCPAGAAPWTLSGRSADISPEFAAEQYFFNACSAIALFLICSDPLMPSLLAARGVYVVVWETVTLSSGCFQGWLSSRLILPDLLMWFSRWYLLDLYQPSYISKCVIPFA